MFQKVVSGFPESRKAPDALLKVAYCQYELKAFRNARATLQKVVSGFPGTDAATAGRAAARADGHRGPVNRLKVTETFVSIQGEADAVGWPTLFIRLTGCPLRCVYCDTQYAFHGGEWRDVDALVETARGSGVRHVCVTGGEPLAQKACLELLRALCDAGFRVSLETSGAMDVAPVDPRVSRVVDLKTPGSGESGRNRLENLALLTPRDQLKVVICSRADYEWARDLLRNSVPENRCQAPNSRCCSRRAGARSSRATSPNGSWPTGWTCGCNSSSTRSCGATSQGDERARRKQRHNAQLPGRRSCCCLAGWTPPPASPSRAPRDSLATRSVLPTGNDTRPNCARRSELRVRWGHGSTG